MSYQCTPGDLEIFKQTNTNANVFLNYYMRSEGTGTLWSPNLIDPERIKGYWYLYQIWEDQGKPERFAVSDSQGGEVVYNLQWTEDGDPQFFHHHGWLMLPWQLKLHHASQPEITVIGGFGTGKTSWVAMQLLVFAATIPNFKAVVVAEYSTQARTIYDYMVETIEGTLYQERFWDRAPTKPTPHIVIKNSHITKSEIRFYSIRDDTAKLRSIEVDMIVVEQAELVKDLEGVDRDLGSRMRGQVKGRERLGRFLWIANAGDNPELWYRFDQAKTSPDIYLSRQVSYLENPYLSPRDLANLRRRAGKTDEERIQWLEAGRPKGRGEFFSRAALNLCHDPTLDEVMLKWGNNKPGFIHEVEPRIGTHRWEIPPRPGRDYLEIADPGYANPPNRNSPVIGVWDITEFPEKPAQLVVFRWVFGNADPWNWINPFIAYMKAYNAHAAFDSTGLQTGYDQLVFAMKGLLVERINMGGNKKMLALNSATMLISRGLLRWPRIEHLETQMLNYKLPDTKIRQDIVSMICMTASWLRLLFFEEEEDKDETKIRMRERFGRPHGKSYERYSRRRVR